MLLGMIVDEHVLLDIAFFSAGSVQCHNASGLCKPSPQYPTSDLTVFAIGGIDVKRTVIVPKRLIDRLDSAAARGSERRSSAVATAEELAPRVTPRVT